MNREILLATGCVKPRSVAVAVTDLLRGAFAGLALQALGVLATRSLDTGVTSRVPMAFANLLRRTVPGGLWGIGVKLSGLGQRSTQVSGAPVPPLVGAVGSPVKSEVKA